MAGKSDIVVQVAKATRYKKEVVAEIVDSVFDTISQVVEEDKIIIKGFGTFSTKHKAAREGRNPATGKTITIAAKDVVHFKPAKKEAPPAPPTKTKKNK